MLKKEGHTHTQFCPHGSGDNTELMVQKAIKMGFQEYSITEHAPLPPELNYHFNGDPQGLTTAALTIDQVEPYLVFAEQLKQQYQDQIKINIGFEVDYLSDFEGWTRSFLEQYGPRTQDNILSVHFMPGYDKNQWCVDYTIADFARGFKELIAEPQRLFRQFLQLELSAVESDLGAYKPRRLGHLTLIRKYQDYFNLTQGFNAANQVLIINILDKLKWQNGQLDINTAGLYKEFCNQVYPDDWIIGQAQQRAIPLVFGSDAHSIAEVGHGYHQVEQFFK